MSRSHIDTLAELAARHRCARVRYRSRLTPAPLVDRLVEPYDMAQGKEDVMVRCYQRSPREGWRYFMAHKIESVEDAGETFEPRRPITLGAEDAPLFGLTTRWNPWTQAMTEYRDLVADALADGVVDKHEFDAIHDVARSRGLTDEQIRYVHAYLLHRCLGAILRDGTVAEPQLAELRLVQRVLSGLGWGVTGRASSPRWAA